MKYLVVRRPSCALVRNLRRTMAGVLALGACSVLLCSCAGRLKMHDVQNSQAVELHHVVSGNGKPVVLLHGFGGSSYSWRKLIPQLSKDHKVIAIDLKGFGAFPKPRDKAYSIYDQASLVTEFIRKNDLRDLVVVGHSFGGGVALLVAINDVKGNEKRVAALILIGSIGYPQKRPQFINMLRMPIIPHLGFFLCSSKQHVRSVLRKAYYDDEKICDDAVAQYADAMDLPGGRHALIETAKQMIPKDIQDLCSEYRSINVPTLIMWGRNDEIVPLEVGRQLNEAIPNSQLVIIEKCGHIPHEEKPEEAITAILKFLRGNSGTREVR